MFSLSCFSSLSRRYVSLTVTPVNDHMLLQLAAYVALLIASKMGETCPLRMKSLANLTGRMFTPLQVRMMMMMMRFFLLLPTTFLLSWFWVAKQSLGFATAEYTALCGILLSFFSSMPCTCGGAIDPPPILGHAPSQKGHVCRFTGMSRVGAAAFGL